MTKGVEYNIGESSVLLQIVKLFFEDSLLAGTPIGLCDNKIEVLVLVSKKTFQFQLRFAPIPENVGNRFGKPNLTDMATLSSLSEKNS